MSGRKKRILQPKKASRLKIWWKKNELKGFHNTRGPSTIFNSIIKFPTQNWSQLSTFLRKLCMPYTLMFRSSHFHSLVIISFRIHFLWKSVFPFFKIYFFLLCEFELFRNSIFKVSHGKKLAWKMHKEKCYQQRGH